MTPEAALKGARKAGPLPLYVVVGEERFLRDQLVADLRTLSLGDGLADFNEDKFTAGEADVEKVLAAARTVPMMASRRFVLVRSLERWDGDSDGAMDRLAAYAADPVPTTCLVLTGAKLDGRRKFASLAKKGDYLVPCEPLGDRERAAWILSRSQALGHFMAPEVAELLAEITGGELSYASDALERLSLYVGPKEPIDEAAVAECVARVRTADTWALVDAVGARDLERALRTLADVYDPRDRGLPLLGALAWSVRQLARCQIALLEGAGPEEAGRAAGAYQPFRARELANKARALRPREPERWLGILAETDLALKSSRRSPEAILEDMITRLCRKSGPSA